MIVRLSSPAQSLYVRSMGKLLEVVAVADNDAEANAYMAKHDTAAVVAVFGPLVFLANKHDRGVQLRDAAEVVHVVTTPFGEPFAIFGRPDQAKSYAEQHSQPGALCKVEEWTVDAEVPR